MYRELSSPLPSPSGPSFPLPLALSFSAGSLLTAAARVPIMVNLLLFLRYVAFGECWLGAPLRSLTRPPAVFIICNAIIASVAVWNLSLARTVDFGSVGALDAFGLLSVKLTNHIAQVDTYLIFVAASGLVLAFTM